MQLIVTGTSTIAFGQEAPDSTIIDTGTSWSLRVFAGQKHLNFSLYDANQRQSMTFRPGNTGNIGIGYAYKHLLLDLAVRLNIDNDRPTARFDIQSSVLVKDQFIDLVFQKYSGFEVGLSGQNLFRDDISMLQTGVNYLFLTNKDVANFSQLKKGYATKRESGSFAFGAFGHFNAIKADSALATTFVAAFYDPDLQNIRNWSMGLSAGYFYSCHFGEKLFLTLGAVPSISLNFFHNESSEIKTNRAYPGTLIQLKSAVGYTSGRHYVILTYNTQHSYIFFNDNHRYQYALGYLRVAYGLRMQGSNALNNLVDRLSIR